MEKKKNIPGNISGNDSGNGLGGGSDNSKDNGGGGRLFSPNFLLLIGGQISSLFANTILRFALSMYILELTGSASVFAGLLAAAMIPTILLSPFGGILADRANRRNIMVALDFLSGVTAFFTVVFIRESNAVVTVGAALITLSVLGAFESPTVQAAVPQMQKGENIFKANAVVNQVAAVAALIAPFLGSACYSAFGLKPVLAVSMAFFFLTALLEVFIRLPFVKQEAARGFGAMIREDFRISIRFLTKEDPQILKMLIAVAAVGFFLMGIANVGLPFLIRTHLGLGAQYVGIAESVCGATAVLGSVLVGVGLKYMKASHMYLYSVAMGVCMIPMGLAFLQKGVMPVYLVVLLSMAVIQVLVSMFSIYCMSLIQQRTPNAILGKVMSYVSTITLCVQPAGQMLYGLLFDSFPDNVVWIMIGSAVCVILFSIAMRGAFREEQRPDCGQCEAAV